MPQKHPHGRGNPGEAAGAQPGAGDTAECHSSFALRCTYTFGHRRRTRPHSTVAASARPQCAVVHLHVPSGICCEAFADIPALGRLAVRDAGRTVFAGVVVEVLE